MKKISISLLAFMGLALGCGAFAQTAKETIEKRKIESFIELGTGDEVGNGLRLSVTDGAFENHIDADNDSSSAAFKWFKNGSTQISQIFEDGTTTLYTDHALAGQGSLWVQKQQGSTANNVFVEFFRGCSVFQSGCTKEGEIRLDGSGNLAFFDSSDRRIKENIRPYKQKVLDRIGKVKIRKYNLIGDNTEAVGVVAQELNGVFPEMVVKTDDGKSKLSEDGEPWKVNGNWNYVLLKAVQELNAKNKAMESWICSREDAPKTLCVGE